MALNKAQTKQLWGALLAIILLLIFDQTSKVLVKTNMQLYESIEIFSWFKIYFVENGGMAFGIELVATYILTIFRIIVVCWFGVLIVKIIKRGTFRLGFIICLSLILAGALGNIIDCAFYGVLFTHSYGQVAQFLPGEGYATLLNGRVVDMLSFPLIRTTWPSWTPFWGGQELVFFRPIFNIADSAICVNVFILLFCYKHSFGAVFFEKDNHTNDE